MFKQRINVIHSSVFVCCILLYICRDDYAGKKQIQVKAAKNEEEKKNIAAWNKEVAGMDALLDKSLEKRILSEHPEVTDIYRGIGIEDDRIARWLEKYPEVELF